MTLANCYGPGRFGLSFELFPPKTEKGEVAMFDHVAKLVELSPSYITCTYGAGGSTRNKTLSIVERVHRDFDLPVASHLTCVGSTVDQLRAYLNEAQERGVENIVALRGDPPAGETSFQVVEGGLRYANELVELIKSEFPKLGIAVAGYPETHQEALDADSDLDNLRRKVDAGGDVVITQLFYDNDDFFRFRDRYDAAGIQAPLVPGLMPVTNFSQIQRITSLCGAKLPKEFVSALEAQGEDKDGQFRVGIDFATKQTQSLIDQGVPGIHFYVLNKSQATLEVLGAVKRPA